MRPEHSENVQPFSFNLTLRDQYLHQGQMVTLATSAADHQLQRKQTAGTVTAESLSHMGL